MSVRMNGRMTKRVCCEYTVPPPAAKITSRTGRMNAVRFLGFRSKPHTPADMYCPAARFSHLAISSKILPTSCAGLGSPSR